MQNDTFYRFGELIYRYRWLAIICWVLLFLTCIPFAPKLVEPFKAIGFTDPHSQSAKANEILNDKLGFGYNQFIILYSSDKLLATAPEFIHEMKTSLAGLQHFSVKHQIIYPNAANNQISKDQHTAQVVVLLKSGQEVDRKTLDEFRAAIKRPANLTLRIGGEPIFLEDTKTQTQIDMYKAEYIATPVAVVTMLVVFGSVVAASLPVIVGLVCALIILLTLYCAASSFPLSVFTLNIALLLGTCLSLDYALLIINRYRDELKKGLSVIEAIAVTQATAGKSVFFSGIAVFISLSALLLFPINVLFSVGVGGLAAVSVAVLVALILLPALLAVVNHHINSLRIFRRKNNSPNSFWLWLVTRVVHRPLVFFCVILLLLMTLGFPFLSVKFGFSDFRILPKTMESREVFDTFKAKFGENKLSPILVLVNSQGQDLLTNKNIGNLYDYVAALKKDPRVDSVVSIVSLRADVTKDQYETLYTGSSKEWPLELKEFVKNSTRNDLTVLTIFSKYAGSSPDTKALIQKIRDSKPGGDLTVDVTGSTVSNMDALKSISHTFPYAFLWIIGFTYLILLVLLRSLFLPLKAIITAMLSLVASYGVLTLVVQFGYLHELLKIEPQEMLDISLLIIIFCALFGISMDYEVFLLTRIKEYYEQTGSVVQSIVQGIDRSCKIISSAAVIVILICFSFMSADIIIVKAFGLGIAVAVFIDAFVIRTMLVPATMVLMGKWNWYLPQWLARILPKITFDQERVQDRNVVRHLTDKVQ